MRVGREFYFDASHFLPDYRGKCERVHGHTYRLDVTVKGKLKRGMVMDFEDLKKVVERRVLNKLDHKNLNDLFENPTAENIAEWIFNELKKGLKVDSIRLWEGMGKWVEIGE